MRTASTLAVLIGAICALPALGQECSSPVYPHLKALECFIGDWEAKVTIPDGSTPSEELGPVAGKQVVLTLSIRWAPGKCAQIINATYQIEDVQIKGTAIRAWDENVIRQYQFTTHKGVWSGTWKKDGGTWIFEYEGKNLDGRIGSGKRLITFKNEDNFVVKETSQMLAGKPQPDNEWHFKRK
jgi:hypothetical protein